MGTKLLDTFLGNFSLILEIWLVANKEEDGVLFRVGFDLIHPKFADIFKAEGIGKVKNKEDALTAPIVGTGNGPKAFLASGVPDLELNIFGINLYGFEPEVDPYSGEVVLGELIVNKTHEDGRLANSRVADYDCFVQVIELLYHAFGINKKYQI